MYHIMIIFLIKQVDSSIQGALCNGHFPVPGICFSNVYNRYFSEKFLVYTTQDLYIV